MESTGTEGPWQSSYLALLIPSETYPHFGGKLCRQKFFVPARRMNQLVRDLVADDRVRMSLHHFSARSEVTLPTTETGRDTLGPWLTCGKLVLDLCAGRLIIGLPGFDKVGSAELLARGVLQLLIARCWDTLEKSGLVAFGDGVTEEEKRSQYVRSKITHQFVGALSNAHGLSKTIEILRELHSFHDLEI